MLFMSRQISISNPSFFSLDEKELEKMSKPFHDRLDLLTVFGGPGKRKISEEDKIFRILSRLPHESLKEVEPGYNKNGVMEEILQSRSLNDKAITALLKRFEDSGIITKRESRKHERGTFFYYTTDKGIQLLEKMKEIRGILPPVNDLND